MSFLVPRHYCLVEDVAVVLQRLFNRVNGTVEVKCKVGMDWVRNYCDNEVLVLQAAFFLLSSILAILFQQVIHFTPVVGFARLFYVRRFRSLLLDFCLD